MDIRGRKMKKPPACVQCRKRKIGCDRVKPICTNCQKNNKSCFYPDVPGKFVVAHPTTTSSPSSDTNDTNEKRTTRSATPSTNNNYSKETNKLVQNNPELASLEHIRDYNTKLQLLSLSNNNNNITTTTPSSTNIPRNNNKGLSLDNNPVETTKDSNVTMNWVQGPAIFDQLNNNILNNNLLKEMTFIKNRLLELQDITGNIINDIDLSSPHSTAPPSPSPNSQPQSQQNNKKRKLSSNHNIINIFKDLDPQFLDEKEIFNIFNNNNNNILKDPPHEMKNSIFNSSFLRQKDYYLTYFIHYLLKPYLTTPIPTTTTTTTTISNFYLPKNNTGTTLIQLYIDHFKESKNLLPFLNINELVNFFNFINLNTDNNINTLTTSNMDTDQLIKLGNLSLLFLIIIELLSSSVLIQLNNQQSMAFDDLINNLQNLNNNLFKIDQELKLRPLSITLIEFLQFITLKKFYSTISSFNNNNNNNNNNNKLLSQFDFDEDIQIALNLSLNHEFKFDKLIILWNFITKNYLSRHIFNGQLTPLYKYNNKTPIMDPLLNNNIDLLNFQSNLINYLQSNDQIISLYKIIGMKDLLKIKFEETNKKWLTMSTLINGNIDSIIYRNTMIHIMFYLCLQHEKNNDLQNFHSIYKDFLSFTQDTIFFIFSNLATQNFIGYEFLFQKRSFQLLLTIIDIILSFYQRSIFAFNTLQLTTQIETDLPQTIKEHTIKHAQNWIIIIRKLLFLLQDYSKNCKQKSSILLNLIQKLEIIITYDTIINYPTTDNDNAISKLSKSFKKKFVGINNIFENVDEISIKKYNNKLNKFSNSLIIEEYYNKREPYQPKNLENFGITPENNSNVFAAFNA